MTDQSLPSRQTSKFHEQGGSIKLRRSLNLTLVVLYGLGVTVGAGIYVLVGATVERAGVHAPIAFVLAAFVMAFTAASFSELTVRMPVSAGEAAFVMKGFKAPWMSLVVGLMVVTSGIVSAAAVAIGSAGYIRVFVDVPETIAICTVVIGIGAIAAWGIKESVTFAAVFTVIELVGLFAIIGLGFYHEPTLATRLGEIVPTTADPAVWTGVLAAGLLAFFAFIGFEDLVNIAEEVKQPQSTLPKAIGLTLLIATLVYVGVVSVSVLLVPHEKLAASDAPLATVFEAISGGSPLYISAIAIVATLNGVIVQLIMVSRVLYGLSRQGQLPTMFGKVHHATQTPMFATVFATIAILLLALWFPIQTLAEWTSMVTLTVFSIVNIALLKIKHDDRKSHQPAPFIQVPVWVPVAGCLFSIGLLIAGFLA